MLIDQRCSAVRKTRQQAESDSWLLLYPFLGASLNAEVCENGQSGILGVKCPFAVRDWKISDALERYEKSNILFLEKEDSGIGLNSFPNDRF